MDYDNPNKTETLSWTLYPESQLPLYPWQVKRSRSVHVQKISAQPWIIIAEFTSILLICRWWDSLRWVSFYVAQHRSSYTRDRWKNFISAAMAAYEFEPYPTVYDGWSARTRLWCCDWGLVTSKSYVRRGKCNIEARVLELMKSQRLPPPNLPIVPIWSIRLVFPTRSHLLRESEKRLLKTLPKRLRARDWRRRRRESRMHDFSIAEASPRYSRAEDPMPGARDSVLQYH